MASREVRRIVRRVGRRLAAETIGCCVAVLDRRVRRGVRLRPEQEEGLRKLDAVPPMSPRELSALAARLGGNLEVARGAGVSPSSISAWRKGKRPVPYDAVLRLRPLWEVSLPLGRRMTTRQARRLDEFRAIAEGRGGCCLSSHYKSSEERLRFRCALGHEWAAIAASIRRGSWCPRCARELARRTRKEAAFRRAREAANARGGRCVSDEYVNSATPLPWRCGQGHEWSAAPTNIIQGSWCPRCARRVVTLEDCRASAAQRGGTCLSETYVNSTTHLRWRCAEGHEWEAIPGNVRRGSWCPECAKEGRSWRRKR